MAASVVDAVRRYLTSTDGAYEAGSADYYARLGLQEALAVYLEGNYGIGAVAVLADEESVREFRARNAMMTGLGVVDHAETRAILKYAADHDPDAIYDRGLNEHTRRLPEGLSMYATLEPCPMCAVALTNVGAVQSVSTVMDGRLVKNNEFFVSDGGATVVGGKGQLQPTVWQQIQENQGLSFGLLRTCDRALKSLSADIFLQTREETDRQLGQRKAGKRADALGLSYAARVLLVPQSKDVVCRS